MPEKTIHAMAIVIPIDKNADKKSPHSMNHSEILKAGAGGSFLVGGISLIFLSDSINFHAIQFSFEPSLRNRVRDNPQKSTIKSCLISGIFYCFGEFLLFIVLHQRIHFNVLGLGYKIVSAKEKCHKILHFRSLE